MVETTPPEFEKALAGIRKRRMFLWTVFLTYLPAIWFALRLGEGDSMAIVVAVLWLLMAATAGGMVGLSRCPACGGLFHMKGIATTWGSKCVHCKQSLSAKK